MISGPPATQPPLKLAQDTPRATSHATWLAAEFRASYAWLKSKIQRRVGSPADAEDLASSSFLELAGVGDPRTVREPRALLTVIAQRLTFEMWRRRDLERAWLDHLAVRDECYAPSAESIAEVSQALMLVDRALEGLSANAQNAFILSQIDGLTQTEIAERLGVSPSMVRKYLASALAKCYLAA